MPSPIRSASLQQKKLRRLAKRDDIELRSLDECHLQRHGSRCRMWVPPEDRDPIPLHAPTRKSEACFGAVSLSTGRFPWKVSPVFDAKTFAVFLRQLLRHRRPGKRMAVVLGNVRYHHAAALTPLLRKYRRKLTLLFLPPYSPQLAPIERGWKLTRRLAMHNRYFAAPGEVPAAAETRSNLWKRPNGVRKQLCCIT